MQVWNVGDRRYELVEGWGALPAGWRWGQVAGVSVDSADNVHVFARTEHPYMVFDKAGALLDSWGNGILTMAHSVCSAPDDSLFFVEHSASVILKFDKAGKHRLTLGTRDQPADTGYTKEIRTPASDPSLVSSFLEGTATVNGVGHGAAGFNQPTDIAVAPDGTLFVSDGYRNARVHRFDADGTLLNSWGEPGNAEDLRDTKEAPARFHTPHGIWVHADKVYVCDRENNRIQIFTLEGAYVDMWTGFLRPTKVYIDSTGVVFVSELDDRVSLLDLEGNRLGHLGYGHAIGTVDRGRSHVPGEFCGPHAVWVDSEESIYVGEVLAGQRLQKFARVA